MSAVVEAVGVKFGYRSVPVLDGVDISLEPGQVLGLLGANGAGKTTFLRLLQGLYAPKAGSIKIWGQTPSAEAVRVRCGLTPQDNVFPQSLKVKETLTYIAKLYPQSQPVDAMLEKFGITDLATRRVSRLSGGQKRRVVLAAAFIGCPQLVMLDEPTAGLDVEVRREILEVIKQEFTQTGVTAIVTSHYLQDIEELADSIAVLQGGRITHSGALADFMNQTNYTVVSLCSAEVEKIRSLLSEEDKLEVDGEMLTIKTPAADALVDRIYAAGVQVKDLSVRRGSLEDAFIGLTRE